MNADGTIVIIGGSSGIGLAAARRCLADGAPVVIAGRSPERLEAAAAELGRSARLAAVAADIGDQDQLTRLFDQAGTLAHLVITAADLPYGPVVGLTEDQMMRAVRSKITGPLLAAGVAAQRINGPGSITFTSGIAAYRPAPGGALATIVNGALDAMVRALALELAPVRVNAVSPGWMDTAAWDKIATPEVKQERLAGMAARLPGRRIGTPDDIANAISFLITDTLITGTVLHAEGGQLLV
jgi:NAD(P)-dependent dehydrogenase (short-subunit alcohol dehydrogenase family)